MTNDTDRMEKYYELVGRAVRGLKRIGRFEYRNECGIEPHPLDCSMAGRVMWVFGIGMTSACKLCEEFGVDPDYRESDEYTQEEKEDDDE